MIIAAPSKEIRPAVDTLPRADALSAMLASQAQAVAVVAQAQPEIGAAAQKIAEALTSGATLYYAAAGSSGLMALADACELPGTFGIDPEQIQICMAGGVPTDCRMPGDVEDSIPDAINAARSMRDGDVAMVLSASGTTPYALAFAQTARQSNRCVISIANDVHAPLLELADIAICLPTQAEIVDGSTRLGAGTAQKIALNMMSTQAGILMGHVHNGMMVNVIADNIKLQQRATRIITQVSKVPESKALEAMSLARNDTKLAILIAAGIDVEEARARLTKAKGHLRDCLPAAKVGSI